LNIHTPFIFIFWKEGDKEEKRERGKGGRRRKEKGTNVERHTVIHILKRSQVQKLIFSKNNYFI
jgi:hypothetical protein